MKKNALSLALALSLCLGLSVPAMAAPNGSSQYTYGPYEFTTSEGNIYRFEAACTSCETLTFGEPTADGSGYQPVSRTVNLVTVAPTPDLQIFVQNRAGEDVFLKLPAYAKEDGMYCLRTDLQYDTFTTDNSNNWFGIPGEVGYSPLLETTDAQGNPLFLRSGNEEAGVAAPSEPDQPEQPGTSFSDVADDAWYAKQVAWAVSKGITSGTSATTFSPNQTCTTAQILTFLWRAQGSPEPTIANPFADVAQDAYYLKPALWAYEKGLVSGTALNGDAPCTRAATVTYLWKLAEAPAAQAPAFVDVAADADCAQAVQWAVDNGITGGISATEFGPANTCTRGQIVTFLYADFAK